MLGKLALGAATGAGLYLAYAAACPLSQSWGRAVYRGPRGRRQLAVSFDDGPSETTPDVLEVLEEYGIRGTFFVCGRNADRLPSVLGETAAAGHEVGNHTFSHPYLPFVGSARVWQELEDTQDAVEEVIGTRPRLFRPPYGLRAPALAGAARALGLTTVLWSVLGRDWSLKASAITNRVLARIDDGSILCLHDGNRTEPGDQRQETVRALREIVPVLLDQGYRFVTCGEMVEQVAPDTVRLPRHPGASQSTSGPPDFAT